MNRRHVMRALLFLMILLSGAGSVALFAIAGTLAEPRLQIVPRPTEGSAVDCPPDSATRWWFDCGLVRLR